MRFLASILIIYMLYMLSTPCVDAALSYNNLFSSNTSQHDQTDGHKTHDACSPFCVCSCCSIAVVLTNYHFDSKPFLAYQESDFPIDLSFISLFIQSIWQPPQLV